MPVSAQLPLPASFAGGFESPALQAALAGKPSLAAGAAARLGGLPEGASSLPGASALPGPSLEAALFSKKEPLERAQATAREFEAIFLRMLLQEMRETVPKSGLFGNSRALEFFESLYDEQVARAVSQAGGFGLSDILYSQLSGNLAAHTKTFSP